jgi:hypothetical protein
MATPTGTVNQPGYIDVADFLIELSREWGGLFRFTVTADRGRRGIPCLFVVLKREPSQCGTDDRQTVRTWANYPNNSNSSLAATMYRLCFEMGEKLDRRRREREAQTAL